MVIVFWGSSVSGAIFEQGTDEIQSAFKFAMLNHNLNVTARRFELQAYVDVINTADAFKLSKLICNQFSRGVFAMLGAVSPDSFDTLHSYSNTFQMPFVTPWFPEKVLTPSSGFLDFAISMRPDYYQAIIDTVRYYGWDRIIYMYDSHDGKLALAFLFLRVALRHHEVHTIEDCLVIGVKKTCQSWGVKRVGVVLGMACLHQPHKTACASGYEILRKGIY
uniref:Receptor ligand binding region domain-containing protein n=1 Tax=Anopheles stephensi TaxID=30069 RepID=A0A182YPK9_ANOST